MAAGTERTPLLAALEGQIAAGRSRLHMPGHKGRLPFPLAEAAPYDLTELPDTDSLYEASGCLLELERRYAALYEAGDSFLSAGGSTLCIQTMLALLGPGAAICCDRTLHTSAMNAIGLLGQRPFFMGLLRDPHGLPLPPSPQQVSRLLDRHPEVKAVYITSPNYYGYLADIPALAAVAHARGALLLIDNAHGAHLPFLQGVCHPMAAGADLCCDSLHKMLPALTGAAVLHMAPGVPFSRGQVKRCMSWFGSTSPSYLILLSCDLLCGQLADRLPGRLLQVQAQVRALCAPGPDSYGGAAGSTGVAGDAGTAGDAGVAWGTGFAREAGTTGSLGGPDCPPQPAGLSARDPLRLALPTHGQAQQMRQLLYQNAIEPELCDALAAVLLFGAGSQLEDFARARRLICSLPPLQPLPEGWRLPLPEEPEMGCLPREAMLAPCELLPVERALGRIAAANVQRCPPGVPLALCGERIGRETILLLKNYGVSALNVIK